MIKRYIVKVCDVVGFTTQGNEGVFESRLLIDKESTGSERLELTHFTLKKGKIMNSGRHPCPFDEVYYVLKGRAIVNLDGEDYEIGPNMAVFIPCGTSHFLRNIGNEDFESINISPFQYKLGVNKIYDERKKQWGKNFKLINEEK